MQNITNFSFEMRYLTLLFIFILSFTNAQSGNDCNSSIVLCAGQQQFADNSLATSSVCPNCQDATIPSGNYCYAPNNTLWFSFLTNDVGGDVSVSVSNMNCNNSAGFNTSMQGFIVEASVPCDASTYTLVSNCVASATNNFTLTANSLSPNTTYYIQIDGDSIAGNSDAAACGFNIEINGPGVEVLIDAGAGSTIFRGESASLSGVGPSNSVWSPGSTLSSTNSPNTVATPDVTTNYFYSTTTSNGCVYSDVATVVVEQTLTITNTFSPNDDGINDFWYISSIEKYPSAKVNVYSRWGQLVYKSVGYNNDKNWDGSSNGIRVPSGVYYYIIDLNTEGNEDVFSGYVTVVR